MNTPQQNLGVIYAIADYAGFFKRVMVAGVDLAVIILVAAGWFYISYDYFVYQDTYFTFSFFFLAIFAVFYLSFLKRSRYRTVGYVLAGLKIVDLNGKKPGLAKMILRSLMVLFGPFHFLIDMFWLTSEVTRQTLRDKYVGTYVVRRDAVPIGRDHLQEVMLGFMGWHLTYWEVKTRRIE